MFLKRSNQNRYGIFLTELQNSAHLNRDEYPTSEAEALDLMVRRSGSFNTSVLAASGGGHFNRFNKRHGG